METLILGLIAGIAPSPHNLTLLGLSLDQSFKECLRFTFSALLFDLLLVLFILVQKEWVDLLIPHLIILKIISLNYVLYLCFRFMTSKVGGLSFKKSNGFIIQAMNPNPYMFWLFVGFPYYVQRGFSNFLLFCVIFLSVTYLTKLIVVCAFKSLQSAKFFAIAKLTLGIIMIVLVNYNFFKIL